MVQDLGGYRLIEELGSGGMGVVYLGVDGGNNPVAVKVLHPHIAGDETARKRLAREVRTLRRIRHPRIAEVLDAELDSEQPFIITEFVDGQTLSDDVRENGPFAEDELVHFGHALLDALNAVHESGVIHRDLKPANVMIMDGEPMVIDFGIAQVADEVRVTATGLVMGTPGYLSPEIADGKSSSEKTDWWGWAATMAFAATGRNPYGSGPLEAVLGRVAMGKFDLEGAPPNFIPLLRACLDPRPERRPSGQMILDALVDIESGRLPQLGSGSLAQGIGSSGRTNGGTAVMPAVPADGSTHRGTGAGMAGAAGLGAAGLGAGLAGSGTAGPGFAGPGMAGPGSGLGAGANRLDGRGGMSGLGAEGHGSLRGDYSGPQGHPGRQGYPGRQDFAPQNPGSGPQGPGRHPQGVGQGPQGHGQVGGPQAQPVFRDGYRPGHGAQAWPGAVGQPGQAGQNGLQRQSYVPQQGIQQQGQHQPGSGDRPLPQQESEWGPAAARRVHTGGWVVFGLIVLAVALMPLSPLILCGFSLLWSILARTASRLDRKTQRYRLEGGGGRLRSVASVPGSLLASTATSAASFILPAVAGIATLVLTRLDVAGIVPGSYSEQWSVWAAGAAGALVLWLGPGAASLRFGSRLLVSGATRNQLGRLIALAIITLLVLLGIMVIQSGAGMNWWPLPVSPFDYLPGPV
ncbi:protein kinase-like protein [Brevibacterium sanguinis]|uniref:non-specific serine/threonine protein kinase n=2 Tax=Brevibacterium TaxID=1696 RepID=A0A366ILN2_9MICO|nr:MULTISPECIES: serine/threonine-protein kinase [Brevibacterium]RBP65548.1 protein kinase-like protein [Brevibacterium sanguinis]RBP72182.1 protein kinase-like protein [Brevibacterium celere]